MRILVTGGAGFIGSHLCELLLAQGHEVTCVDSLLTAGKGNLEHLTGRPGFSFRQGDVSAGLRHRGPLEQVLHLASPASPVDYYRYPVETLMVGSYGTHHALELARSKGAVFLLTSTSEVYGDPQEHPQREEYWGNVNPVGPRSVYDEAKRYAEAVTMAYHRAYGLPTRIARIFNTYGPRLRAGDGRAIPNFIRQALAGEPLTVYGDGSQTRSFCYVADLMQGLSRLALSEVVEPVNLGNPQEMTVLELAQKIIALTGSQSVIVHQPLPQDDPKVRRPDITRALQRLGWEPATGLEEGLRETIRWFRETPGALGPG
ncbi:MAG: SDR family oxidoreductase [Chloroflexi bacterium]|nr:SDR family oxidoreductase [Chloroflexota bacterium]